jgi:signal transduction histidine kinase
VAKCRCTYHELVTGVRPYLRYLAVAILLATASALILDHLYTGGPVQDKLVLSYFGTRAGLGQALRIWWLYGGLIIAGLLVVHRWPSAALVLTAAGAAGHQFDPRLGLQPLDLAVPIVLYLVASRARARWVPVASLAVVAVGEYLLTLYLGNTGSHKATPLDPPVLSSTSGTPFPGSLLVAAGNSLPVLMVLAIAVAIGDGVRSRREHLRTLEQRAADLEREQQQRAALAAAAERARISREMHDVVAHSLSVIVAQAQGAAAALRNHPDRAATALQHVITTGRGSLAEIRRLLGLVRDPGPEQVVEPGVGALSGLVDKVSAAGLRTRLHINGDPAPLPSTVDSSTYRIVQEALTNALKHAGAGARASVRLRFHPDTLEVEVTDDGRGQAAEGGNGHGLIGIAERVDLLGGELEVGPAGTTGFRVYARLPIEARA